MWRLAEVNEILYRCNTSRINPGDLIKDRISALLVSQLKKRGILKVGVRVKRNATLVK